MAEAVHEGEAAVEIMIDRHEIEGKAEEFDINVSDVQRDYVFGWILAGIYSSDTLKDVLFLKGGNAFRKAYFESTRFSRDLDFGTERDLEPSFLAAELNRVCEFIEAKTGVKFDTGRNSVEAKFRAADDGNPARQQRILHARIYFKDFYGNSDHIVISVRMDVTMFDRLYAPVQTRNLIHPYSDAADCQAQIKCVKLEELLAIKIKCLMQRQHSFDLFDLLYAIFVDGSLDIDRREIITVFLKRTIFESSPGVVKGLLLGLPIQVFRGHWDEFLACPKTTRFTFDQAAIWFADLVDELFGQFPVTRYGTQAYFSSENRNAIMEAGRTQTLLKIAYDGVTREVEPYSLAYKKAQGGPAREYFYVWDRTGGMSRAVGIKSFVQPKIQGIENTDIVFEPRFEIELAKAGERSAKAYFSSPFASRRSTSSRPPRSRTPSVRYVIECLYCGRRFGRQRLDTMLRPHKDRSQNPCFGRRGTLTDTRFGN